MYQILFFIFFSNWYRIIPLLDIMENIVKKFGWNFSKTIFLGVNIVSLKVSAVPFPIF